MEPCEPTLLLRRYAQSGCQEAFSALVQRYVGLVYGAALRRLNGDVPGAEDVVQRVFMDLAVDAHRLRANSQLGGWLYRRAVRAAADYQKAERRRRAREVAAVDWAEPVAVGEGGEIDVVAAVEDVLARLSRGHREVLVLRFLEERSMREVGEALGLSEDAAQKRVARALDRLRHFLRGRGVAPAPVVLFLAQGGLSAAPPGLGAVVTTALKDTLLSSVSPGRVGPTLLLSTTMNAKPLLAAAAAIAIVASVAVPWLRSSALSSQSPSSVTPATVLMPPPLGGRKPGPPTGIGISPPTNADSAVSSAVPAPPSPSGAPEPTTRQRVEEVTLQRYEEKMERLKRKLNLTPDQLNALAAHHLAQREKWIDYLTAVAENRADPRHYSLEAGYREDVPSNLQSMLSADQLALYNTYDANKRTNHIEAVTSGEINYLAQRLDLDAAGKDALFARLAEINQTDLFADLGAVADLDAVAQQADRDVARRRAAFAGVLDAQQMKVWEGVVADYRRELLKRYGDPQRTAGQAPTAPAGQSS